MSALKLILPGGKSLILNSPFKKQTHSLTGISLIVNMISLAAVSIFALFLPVSGTFFSSDSETSTIKFLILCVFAFLTIFILKLSIQGGAFIIEPKGLLMILVLNLILTTLSILITTIRVSNTFGTTGFRYLSGVALMSLIGLFYFLNLYLANAVNARRFINLLSLGTILYVVVLLVTSNQTSNQIISNLPMLTIGFMIFVYSLLQNKSKVSSTFTMLILGLLILVATPIGSATYANLLHFTIVLLISYLLVLTLYILKRKKELKLRFSQIKSNIVNFIKVKKVSIPTNKSIDDLHLVIVFVMPVILLLSALFFYFNVPTSARGNLVSNIGNHYVEGLKIISAGSDTINGSNIRSILMGVGGDNYNPARPFFVNVLVVSGIVGGLIYLGLWLFFIKAAKDLFVRKIKSYGDYKLVGISLLSVILIPLMLLISYSNILVITILWIMYSIISAKQGKLNLNYLDNSINSEKRLKPTAAVFKFLGISILLLGIAYSLNLILIILK